MTNAATLRQRLSRQDILIAPGIYDAFGATIAEQIGFEALFVSGSALAAAHLGRPDIGLLSLAETATIVGRIADRVSIPLCVDADQGGGNAHVVARNIRLLERAGAACVQIEDQYEIKPVDYPLSRPLIPAEMMVGKIKAAKDACRNDTLISARSDAASSEGVDAAIERALSYIEAGADMIFVESLTKRKEMQKLIAAIDGRVPVLHNLLREGDEVRDAATLEDLGYSLALFPAAVLQAAGSAINAALEGLRAAPSLDDEVALMDWVDASSYFAAFKGG